MSETEKLEASLTQEHFEYCLNQERKVINKEEWIKNTVDLMEEGILHSNVDDLVLEWMYWMTPDNKLESYLSYGDITLGTYDSLIAAQDAAFAALAALREEVRAEYQKRIGNK